MLDGVAAIGGGGHVPVPEPLADTWNGNVCDPLAMVTVAGPINADDGLVRCTVSVEPMTVTVMLGSLELAE